MSGPEIVHGSVLGLGGADLGNHRVRLSDETALQILDEAWAVGVRTFDTAPHYGLGLSERRLRSLLSKHRREEYRLTTKVGRRLVPSRTEADDMDDEGFLVRAHALRVWDFSADGIRASLEDSLDRLGVDHVDVAYLHDPERWDLDAALASGLPALTRLRVEGLVGAVGVASMSLDTLVAAAGSDRVDELMVACRLTLVDRAAEEELLPLCVEAGTDVVAAAVFNGGLLADTPSDGATHDYVPASPQLVARARRIQSICEDFNVPLPAAALQYPLRLAPVRGIVVGAVAPGQVTRNADLLAHEIPSELWSELAAESAVVR